MSIELSPNGKPIVGSGYVVRVLGGNRLGIQLSRLPAAETGRLQQFLLPLILRNAREAKPVNTSPTGGLAIHSPSLRSGQAE